MRCSSYCTANSFQFNKLYSSLAAKYPRDSLTKLRELIHLRLSDKDLFIFSFGSLVFWGFKKEEESDFLALLSPFEVQTLDEIEKEETELSLATQTKIRREGISLAQDDPKTKLAISYGLAQSVKLTLFEEQIEKTIISTKSYPEEMAIKGKISLSRKDIARKMGKLMIQRNSINLHTEILDTPEYFWECPELEPLYNETAIVFEIANRVEILNKRLDIIKDSFELLSNELNHQHSSFLEWIIIILILLEVVIAVAEKVL